MIKLRSGLIDSNGIILKSIKSTERGVIEVDRIKNTKNTFFSGLGNKIFFYFLIFYTILLFLNFKGRKKS